MMRFRFVVAVAVGLSMCALSVGSATAQQVVEVTVASTQQGSVGNTCPPQPPGLSATFPEFVLTRSGDVTDGLTVTIAWSGELTTETTVSPTAVVFAPGSSTATVTAMFTPSGESFGDLTLTVTPAAGYQPGDPATATTTVVRVEALCALPPTPPPPIVTNPTFTG